MIKSSETGSYALIEELMKSLELKYENILLPVTCWMMWYFPEDAESSFAFLNRTAMQNSMLGEFNARDYEFRVAQDWEYRLNHSAYHLHANCVTLLNHNSSSVPKRSIS